MAFSTVSDLRIVLLGKNISETSRVGNFILGRDVFETETSFSSVEQFKGIIQQVKGRYITLINAPHLSGLPTTNVTERVKECAALSAPGPHVFLVVIQPDHFTKEDTCRLNDFLNTFSEEAVKYTIVITTDCCHVPHKTSSAGSRQFKELLNMCSNRHHRFEQMDNINNCDPVQQLFEKIDNMVKENGGAHLTCEIFEDALDSVQDKDKPATHKEKIIGTVQKCIEFSLNLKETGKNKVSDLRIVLLGKNVPETSRVGNFILGRDAFETEAPPPSVEQQSERVRGQVEGRYITLIHTPHLLHPKLTQEELNQRVKECVSLSDPGPHVFLLVLRSDNFTKEDHVRMRRVLDSYGPLAMKHSVVVTTGEDHNTRGHISTFIRECGGRHHISEDIFKCHKHQVLHFLKKIDEVVEQTGRGYFTCEMAEAPALELKEEKQSGPSVREPEQSRPSGTEPEQTGSSGTEPVQTGPSGREPEQSGPSETEPEQSGLCETEPDQSGRTETEPDQSGPSGIEADQARSSGRKPEQSGPSGIEVDRSRPSGREPDQSAPSEMEPHQAGPSGTEPEQSGQSGTDADQPGPSGREPDQSTDTARMDYIGGLRNRCQSLDIEHPNMCPKLNLVLCGSDGAMKSSISDFILGQGDQRAEPSSECVRRKGEVCGYLLTLMEIPALYNTQLSEDEVMRETLCCVSLCDPGIHAFLFIIPVGLLRTEDKGEMEKIHGIFSSELNNHTMVLIITKTECDNSQLPETTQAFIHTYRGRCHVISLGSNPSELLQKVELMVLENNGSCYTTALYLNAQMETGLKHQAEMRRHICALKSKIQRQSQALRASSNNLRIILLGKTGVGKSATGNTILGRDVFNEDGGFESLTRVCQKETAEFNGRQISVIDTPGLFDTELDNELIKTEISKCISLILPGPHVFLLVLNMRQRFSKEERETVKIIQDIFGEGSVNYTIVLFTRGDELKKPIKEYTRKPGSEILKIIEQCGNRYHVFNNKDTRDPTQVTVLLDKIDTMVTVNGGSYYTNEMFQQVERKAREEQDRILKESQEQIVKEKEELKIKYETEIERMRKTIQEERQNQNDERKTREENEKQLRRYIEYIEEQQRLAFKKEEEYEKRKMDYEKRIEEKEKKYREMEIQIEEFKKQRHDDQLRREQEDEKRREKEEREWRQWQEEQQLNHHLKKDLEMKVQAEVKYREGLMLKHQQEMEIMRKTMEDDRLEQEKKRDQEIKNTKGEFQAREHQLEAKHKVEIDRIKKEEERERRILGGKLKHAEEILQEERKMSVMCQRSLDTIMKEGTFMKCHQEEYNQHRKEDIQEMKMCCTENVQQKGEAKLEQVMSRLNFPEWHHKLLTAADFIQISKNSPSCFAIQTLLNQLLKMDYRGRYCIKHESYQTNNSDNNNKQELGTNPMDVQMAVFHCSNSFLKQLIVTKLSQCQFALPLLVPDPITREIEFPLWTFRQIKKSWKTTDGSGKSNSLTKAIYDIETPMVAFFRFGSVSTSKSQLINSLINEKHNTFFHRHCPGSSRNHLLMDGVVEIAWYLPSGNSSDHFCDCIAFCNLHGNAGANEKQYDILISKASVNVVFLPDFGQRNHYKGLVRRLFCSPHPLICLLADDESTRTEMGHGKYCIGLKDRNISDLSEELITTIRLCLSMQSPTFKLLDLTEYPGLRIDEDNDICKTGKQAALKMMDLLEGVELSAIKETYLPCQGKKWHEWCQKNKELHRGCGKDMEKYKSVQQEEMKEIRKQQQECGVSKFMDFFIKGMNSSDSNEKLYFLKWIEIFLDKLTVDNLCTLQQKYDDAWSKVSSSKKNSDKSEQKENEKKLTKISGLLNSASFGLEHILREMGQIFESHQPVQNFKREIKQNSSISSFPTLAAQLILSGHPIELMDGDAGHVPLIWVSAVLDELIKILGDHRVFVLSILGIQSSGKSTMLNAMFGLQFAVSAGRCTRGAFMQLIKVSEEMKAELKFDYMLVVDTEGLRALEMEEVSTRHHDNELATFVVGLGNLTLINIFGENPAEMQDILQIVVQTLLRMKLVRLNPSCMFVHQNVPDVTAKQKNMEGKRRLLEKLDEMTKLAAQEECCDAECFNDVITFNIEDDVRYFAQLWEGSPPMAPQNPQYSENVQELRNTILSHASNCSILTLSQFKTRVVDLWNALLHENFVFSFRNTLEIAVYRKLEEEYGKWTWCLRSAMLEIQEKLHTRINNNNQLHQLEYTVLENEMEKPFNGVQESVKCYFDKEQGMRDILQQWRGNFEKKVNELHKEIVQQAKRELNEIIQQRNSCRKLEKEKSQYETKLLEKSKELALELEVKESNEVELKKQFDAVWKRWVSELTADNLPMNKINIEEDTIQILSETRERKLVCERLKKRHRDISLRGDYTKYVKYKKNGKLLPLSPTLLSEEQDSIRQITLNAITKAKELVKTKPVATTGYKSSYIQEIIVLVNEYTAAQNTVKYQLTSKFSVDLVLHVCYIAEKEFVEQQKKFSETNDPVNYLEKMKPEYYSIFQKYCQGATSTAVFGGLICSKLGESILQSVYNRTASDLAGEMRSNLPAFNGNRTNMEKHILKTLAEEEDIEKFKIYLLKPREHFENFIKDEVQKYITKDNPRAKEKMTGIIVHKKQCVITAAETGTRVVTQEKGNVNTWLKAFSEGLKDELEYNTDRLSGNDCQDISDFQLLTDVVKKEICVIAEQLNRKINSLSDLKMENVRKRPDDILIEHFCKCCWVQCPFCKAICTNTMEDHDGDHSVPFHRANGINGWYYRGTTNLCNGFCTTVVQSEKQFHPNESDWLVPYKNYRTAGEKFSVWSITPDNSELPYWKWFMCRFQKDLEDYYKKTFEGSGQIPDEWRRYSKEDAILSLDKYI